MTQTTSPSGAIDTAADPRPARGRRRMVAVAVVGVMIGVAIGVLTLRESAAPSPSGAVTRPTDLGDQLAALQARVDRSPDDLTGWQELASVAVRRAAQTGDPAYYPIAERALERADGIAADDPFTLAARGELALALHDFRAALRHGRRAARDVPDNAGVLGIIVDAQVELGRYEAAAATLQQMLDVRPGASALSRVSYLRELHGDAAGAASAMARAEAAASAATPARATITALRGELAFDRGALQDAAEHYARAREAAPELVTAAVGAARARAAGGDVTGAIDELTTVVERLPTPEAVVLLADLQHLAGDAAAAADSDALARTLTRLQSQQGQTVDLELAVFEADRAERPARAVTLARRAHDARPDNVYAADALAWALARRGDVDAALPLIRRALRLGSTDPQLRFHAAWIFARVGDTDAAARHLRFVAERNPWFSFALLEEAGRLARELGVEPPTAWRRA